MREGVVLERVTLTDGEHTCDVITVHFDPVRGSTFECGSCGNQVSALSPLSLPKSCRNCKKRLRLCDEGFPRDYLEKAKQYG